jgi:tRNA (guanine-N7-)-methyltransferase
MKTDNYNLFVYSLKSLSKYGYYFEELSFDLHNDEDIDELLKNPTTEYEDKFIEKNRQIYYVVAIKKK